MTTRKRTSQKSARHSREPLWAGKWARVGLLFGLLVVWFAFGWRHVPHEKLSVRDSVWLRVQPVRLNPGWHWVPPFLMMVRSYPGGLQRTPFKAGVGPRRLVTREGAAVAVTGSVEWQVDRSGLTRLALQAGDDVEKNLLAPAISDALRQILAQGEGLKADAAGNRRLAERLAPRLAVGGVSLISVTLAAVGSPGEVLAAGVKGWSERRNTARVLLVGWDGADWNLIQPLLQQGSLPNLARLIREGARGRLKTVTPVLSPVVWTSVITGVSPEKHGIVDFLAVDPASGARIPVTSNLRKVPALWNMLDRQDLSSGVVGWWATWPAEKIRGYMVTDRLAYQLFGMDRRLPATSAGKTWPPDLYDEIAGLVVSPSDIRFDDVQKFASLPAEPELLPAKDRELLAEFRTVLAATRTYASIALHLASIKQVALRCIYFESSDTAAHLFMPFHPPRREGIDPERFRLWSGVLDGVYVDLDRRLGQLLETTDQNTTVMVVSDHGFRSGDNRPEGEARIGAGRAAEWHRKYGIVVISGRGVKRGVEIQNASVLDIAPTILALLGLPVPARMEGKVLADAVPVGTGETPSSGVGLVAGEKLQPASPVASPDDAAILKRLESLGYIGPGDVSRLKQDQVTAFSNRATILLSEGKPQEAIKELERGLAHSPQAIPLKSNLGRALHQVGEDERALRMLKEVLNKNPDMAGVENLVGNIYMDRGDLARAATHFHRALELEPNLVEGHISLGLLAEKEGRLDDALDEYRRAGEIDPDAAEGFNNMGNIHRQRALQARAFGKEKEAQRLLQLAESSYRRAIKADADFIGAYNNLALVYQDSGRAQEAMDLYLDALKRSPHNAIIENNLGSLYFAAGRLADAREAFQSAIKARPDYDSAYNNLGAVLGRLGLKKAEMEAYRKAVQLNPDYADGFHNLGLALLKDGDLDGARKAFARTLAIEPAYLSAYSSLAVIEMREGSPRKAVQHLAKALKINPSLYGLHNQLAEAYLASGDKAKGMESLRQSLKIFPQQPEIRHRLESLEK